MVRVETILTDAALRSNGGFPAPTGRSVSARGAYS